MSAKDRGRCVVARCGGCRTYAITHHSGESPIDSESVRKLGRPKHPINIHVHSSLRQDDALSAEQQNDKLQQCGQQRHERLEKSGQQQDEGLQNMANNKMKEWAMGPYIVQLA